MAAGVVVGVVMVMSIVVAIVHGGLLLVRVAKGVAVLCPLVVEVVVVVWVAEGQAVVTGLLACLVA